ncbi:HNH endonuclease [Clostridium sp. VAP41]|uniref:HNH endonuclease n=1 Tax=Clostridium sp. VAP41 TaxID=2949979 RepID=UPI00207AC8E6|nr:HNH endonuclease [Clostridium sp. VAP41]
MRGWIQANTDPKSKDGYNLFLAYDENKVLPWSNQGVLKGFKKDDTVFIIVKDNCKNKVMYKCVIVDDSADVSTTINDSVYYYHPLTREENDKNRTGTCFLLEKFQYIKDDDRLYMKTLKEQGLTKREYDQGSTRDKNPKNIALFDYLDRVFDEHIDDEYMKDIYEELKSIEFDSSNIEEKYREGFIKTRIGQGKFREALIKKYGCECSVCGLNIKELLIASHIKEYSNCIDNEHIDLHNGLLLCANHDKLFDKHLISFDNKGKIVISSSIDSDNYDKLNINKSTAIDARLFKEEYMNYHRGKLV